MKSKTNDISILYFDIETTPEIVAQFGIRGKKNTSHTQVLKRSVVMCISWAWNDANVQHKMFDLPLYDWYSKDDDSDYNLIKDFTEQAQRANLVIGHNAKMFDIAYLRSRIIKYQLPDFNPALIDDTYQSTKDIRFMSHKLDDLGDYLGYGNKEEHGNGYEWWIDVMRGDKTRLKEMVKYCDIDVERDRQIYKHLSPYVKSNLNASVFYERPDACPNPLCGQSERPMIIRGYNTTRAGKYPKLQCPVCNTYCSKGENQIGKKYTGHAAKEYNR